MTDVAMATCRWLENTSWAAAIRESPLAYPMLQWIHFAGLAVWLAACLTVDVRLIGIGPRRQTAAELTSGLFAWKWIGFGVALAGGFLLFSAYATMYARNGAFMLKVAVLTPIAVLWHLVVQKGAKGQWAGAIELVLWILVVTAAVAFLLTNVS